MNEALHNQAFFVDKTTTIPTIEPSRTTTTTLTIDRQRRPRDNTDHRPLTTENPPTNCNKGKGKQNMSNNQKRAAQFVDLTIDTDSEDDDKKSASRTSDVGDVNLKSSGIDRDHSIDRSICYNKEEEQEAQSAAKPKRRTTTAAPANTNNSTSSSNIINDSKIIFELRDGSLEYRLDHPIVKYSQFVRDAIKFQLNNEDSETDHDDEEEFSITAITTRCNSAFVISIPLQNRKFLSTTTLKDICDFLVYVETGGSEAMKVGQHAGRSFASILQLYPDYYEECLTDPRSNCDMWDFVKWRFFDFHGCQLVDYLKVSKGHLKAEIIQVANFFQIELCSGCGAMKAFCSNNVPKTTVLKSCRHKKKPCQGRNNDRVSTHNAAPVAPSSICICTDWYCVDCIADGVVLGCENCGQWETPACRDGLKEPGKPAMAPMNAGRCLGPKCGAYACIDCANECCDCNRKACLKCQDDKLWPTSCTKCIRDISKKPASEQFYLCRECIERNIHYCNCGRTIQGDLGDNDEEEEVEAADGDGDEDWDG
jgi:hypothetical protein